MTTIVEVNSLVESMCVSLLQIMATSQKKALLFILLLLKHSLGAISAGTTQLINIEDITSQGDFTHISPSTSTSVDDVTQSPDVTLSGNRTAFNPASDNQGNYTTVDSYTTDEQTSSLTQLTNVVNDLKIFFAVTGITGNVMNIIVCVSAQFRTQPITLYLFTLAISDTIGLYVGGIDEWCKYRYNLSLSGLADNCNVRSFLSAVVIALSAYLLCAINLQRFVAVKFPLKAKIWLRTKVTVISIVATLVSVVAVFTPMLFALNPETCYANPGWENYTYTYIATKVLFITNIIPHVILFTSTVLLIIAVKTAFTVKHQGNGSESGVHGGHQALNVAKCVGMTITLATTHLVLTLPSIVAVMYMTYFMPSYIYGVSSWFLTLFPISMCFVLISHALNFPLCIATSSTFRQAFITVVCCSKNSSNSSDTSFTDVSLSTQGTTPVL